MTDDHERDAVKRPLPLPDDEELRRTLAGADVPTLLLTYVHLTGDEQMLERFAPHHQRLPMQQPDDIPTALTDELRTKLHAVLTGMEPVRDREPSAALLQRMMSVSVGEHVDDEFVPLLFDQIGLQPDPPRREIPTRPMPPTDFHVVVIGAGLTGIAAGVKLQEAGYTFTIIEKNADIGGSWYENRYPGVGVDTPSHFYSYSFEIWPDWTYYKPLGDEMHRYFSAVVDKHGLRARTRFETTTVSCVFDDDTCRWHVTVRTPSGSLESISAHAVIHANGPLSRPVVPDIPGLDQFGGPAMHTSRWDPDVDLGGKSVGVIGTGASGIQVVPAIADEASHVTVFMRSRYWVMTNRRIDEKVSDANRFAMRYIPNFREWFRFRTYWLIADGNYQYIVVDPDWKSDVSISEANERLRQFAEAQIREDLGDRPDLLEKLLPDFPYFSKRPLNHPLWWKTLKRDDVTVETTRIERILPHGVRMVDGTEHAIDALVLATGFDVSNVLGDLDVVGRDGRSLRDEWGAEDARAYMGVAMPGFPNFFQMVGPNSAPNFAAGQNLISEVQVHYVIECLDWMLANDALALEPTSDAFVAWNQMIDEQLAKLIWDDPRTPRSYYHNSKGRNFLSWPYRLVDYWNHTRAPVPDDFQLHR